MRNDGGFKKGFDARRGQGRKKKGNFEVAKLLRELLEGDTEKVHAALMRLIEAGDSRAILYAHQQLVGKPPESADLLATGVTTLASTSFMAMSDAALLKLATPDDEDTTH